MTDTREENIETMWWALREEWNSDNLRAEQRSAGFDAFKETFAAGWERALEASPLERYRAALEEIRDGADEMSGASWPAAKRLRDTPSISSQSLLSCNPSSAAAISSSVQVHSSNSPQHGQGKS